MDYDEIRRYKILQGMKSKLGAQISSNNPEEIKRVIESRIQYLHSKKFFKGTIRR